MKQMCKFETFVKKRNFGAKNPASSAFVTVWKKIKKQNNGYKND